jgi:hypothetical protein
MPGEIVGRFLTQSGHHTLCIHPPSTTFRHRVINGKLTSSRGGGVYLWKNIEAAKKAHGPAFEEAIQSIFGSKPEFQYFEAPIVIDNAAKAVVDNAA